MSTTIINKFNPNWNKDWNYTLQEYNSSTKKYEYATKDSYKLSSDSIENISTGIDLINYFGIDTDGRNKTLLKNCKGTDLIYTKNSNKKQLTDLKFSDIPVMYVDSTLKDELLLKAIPETYYLTVSEKYIELNSKFIVVFVDGKYTTDWHCESTILYLHFAPKFNFEIYLLSEHDYNATDLVHYYSNGTDDICFTFNNLRLNQFMEHHLNIKSLYILGNIGIRSFVKKSDIKTRHLIHFASFISKKSTQIKIKNVVQNQSETYEDVVIRKRYTDQPNTQWSKDFSLWAGVKDIYATSNSSSTLLFDQYGKLIDPKAIDWFNKRLAPYSSYDYVEIQPMGNRVYTGEIYFPSLDYELISGTKDHTERDPYNEFRYKNLYETNYNVVYVNSIPIFEYDTYYKKIFETLHLEETVYVEHTVDPNEKFPVEIQLTKKSENLLLDDIILNNIFENDNRYNTDPYIITNLTSVQIQSDCSFIRRVIVTNNKNDLKIEVTRNTNILVFVDGEKQLESEYTTSVKNGKQYITLNKKYADSTEHVVNIFFYNKNNIISKKSYQLTGTINDFDFFTTNSALFTKYEKMLPQFLLYGYIGIDDISSLIYVHKVSNDEVSSGYPNKLCVPGTGTHPTLDALASKLVNECLYGKMLEVKLSDQWVSGKDIFLDIDGYSEINSPYDFYTKNGNLVGYVGSKQTIHRTKPSIIDILVIPFYYPDDNNVPTYGELPLSYIFGNPVFAGIAFDLYTFEKSKSGYKGAYNFSIDHSDFNSIAQSFTFNNLRKNIYMEHYSIIHNFHIFTNSNFYIQSSFVKLKFTNLLNFNFKLKNYTLVQSYDKYGTINIYDTLDANFFDGGIYVRPFIDSSLEPDLIIIKKGSIIAKNSIINDTIYKNKLDKDINVIVDSIIEPDSTIVTGSIINGIEYLTTEQINDKIIVKLGSKIKKNSIIASDSVINSLTYTSITTLDEDIIITLESIIKSGSKLAKGSTINGTIYNTLTALNGDIIITSDDITKPSSITDNYNFFIDKNDISWIEGDDYTLSFTYRYNFTTEYSEFDIQHSVMEIEDNLLILVTDELLPVNTINDIEYDDELILKSIKYYNPSSTQEKYFTIGKETKEYVCTDIRDDKTITRTITSTYNTITITFKSDAENINSVRSYLSNCYIYTRQVDTKTKGDKIYYLESGFNKLATLAFDNNGYLISPDGIDWSCMQFYFPLISYPSSYSSFENSINYINNRLPKINNATISILPLHNSFPSIVDEVYDIALNKEKIMNLRLNDFIDIDDDYQRIGSNIDDNGDYIENTGLKNNSKVPIIPTLLDKSSWYKLSNNSYIYWIEPKTEENMDKMKLIADEDDAIDSEEVFVFINGIKIFEEDLEINLGRHMYTINNFSKYKRERFKIIYNYKLDDIEKLLDTKDSIDNYYKKLYIDENNKFTFTPTTDIVTVDDDSWEDNIKVISTTDITKTTRLVVLANREIANEIVVFNYKIDDIEYIIKDNVITYPNDMPSNTIIKTKDKQKIYTFPGYKDYDLKRYVMVFVNGLRNTNYTITEDSTLIFNKKLSASDRLEIYVFKKFDYNWHNYIKYNQYNNNRFFYAHNLKEYSLL